MKTTQIFLFALMGCTVAFGQTVSDTRSTNEPPTFYNREVKYEFKSRTFVGAPGSGPYSGLMTFAPWSDDSGGFHHQLNFNNGGLFYRTGLPDNTQWNGWSKIIMTNSTNDLDLEGSISIDANDDEAISLNTNDNGFQYMSFRKSGTRKLWLGLHLGDDFHIQKENGGNIILDGSNIGIGTTNPVSRLEVNGDISLARMHKIKFLETVNGGDRAYIRSTNGEGGDFNSMIFAIGGGNESMIIKNDGNVGIGTTAPDDKLTVKGRIHAEEVKVDLSVPGPDYVFKEGYDLKSLEEVQKHIREKGHLPNIPSAQEMEENGVELGIMNMKLLEKIEELTLYQLQLLQQLEASHTEIEKLKMRVEHLEGK